MTDKHEHDYGLPTQGAINVRPRCGLRCIVCQHRIEHRYKFDKNPDGSFVSFETAIASEVDPSRCLYCGQRG